MDLRKETVQELCTRHHVTSLSSFQRDLLEDDRWFSPGSHNLLFSAPTGSGKSLVAEIVACVNARIEKKRCLFIQPYVASATEVFFNVQRNWRPFGMHAKAHYGAASLTAQDEYDAVVCTIEKSGAMINKLIKDKQLDQFCTIVMDEVHMFYDNDRGSVLEDMLIKLRYMNHRVIAMSATIEDPTPLEFLLNTSYLDYTGYRSVTLSQYFTTGNKFWTLKDSELEVCERELTFNFSNDPNGLLNLVMEKLVTWEQVLIFCRTKVLVEKTAKLIACCVSKCTSKDHKVFARLKQAVDNECPKQAGFGPMDQLLSCGVAYHHSGVATGHRRKIEELFAQKNLAVIVCTTTLSTGVNLPASRVIVVIAEGCKWPLSYVVYHQMVGRTGRERFGAGDSYLVASNFAQLQLTCANLQKRAFQPRRLDYTHLILDAVAIRLVSRLSEAESLIRAARHDLQYSLPECVDFLRKHELLGVDDSVDDVRLAATQLGSAISATFLTPNEGLFVYKELCKAMSCMDFRSDLQMLYLVTPLASRTGFKDLDLTRLLKWHERLLTPVEKDAAKKVGVTTASCLKLSFRQTWDEVHARFYLTLVLRECLNKTSEFEILKEFCLDPVQLDLLKVQVVVFWRTIAMIADHLGWSYMKDVMTSFGQKVELVVNPEVSDLLRLPGIDGTRALHLVERGISSVRQLASTEPPILERILRLAVPFSQGPRRADENEWIRGLVSDCETAVEALLESARQLLSTRVEDEEDSEMTVDMSVASQKKDRRKSLPMSLGPENWLVHRAEFVVLDQFSEGIGIYNNNGVTVFVEASNTACETCANDSLSELEVLFASDVPKYVFHLSLMAFRCKDLLLQVSHAKENPNSFLESFHCVSSILRVRNRRYDVSAETPLDFAEDLLKRFGSTDSVQTRLEALRNMVQLTVIGDNFSEKEERLVRVWNESVHSFVYMGLVGFQVDLSHFEEFRSALTDKMSREESEVWAKVGKKFNMYRVSETRKVLGSLPDIPRTLDGTVPGTLEELRQCDHPLIRHIIEARNAHTAVSQLEKVVECVDEESRIRPFYNTLSHCTGRVGIEEPPIQMLTKRKVVNGLSARSVLMARPDHLLMAVDYSQLELRMILALSRDELLSQLVSSGQDPFEYLSGSLREKGVEVDRDRAKTIFYAVIYGICQKSLAAELGISREKAEHLLNVFASVFSGVHHWLAQVSRTALDRGYVTNIWGLGIGLNDMRPNEARRRIPNFVVQMHDEIICEVRSDRLDDCVQLIKPLMENELLGVRFPVKVKVGPNWDQMETYQGN